MPIRPIGAASLNILSLVKWRNRCQPLPHHHDEGPPTPHLQLRILPLERVRHRAHDDARADGVDADVERRQLDGQRADQPLHPGLGHVVDGQVLLRDLDALPGDRGDQDDAAAPAVRGDVLCEGPGRAPGPEGVWMGGSVLHSSRGTHMFRA